MFQAQPSAKKFTRSLALLTVLILGVFVSTASISAQDATPEATPATGEPITLGVSGPLTGPEAQYGAQWKKGFDLALEEINGAGGVDGRPLQYDFEDSQSDPTQSVVVAQKFVSDPDIIAELGDFASTASMAASSIYTRGGLVQFGFTNSNPDFTKASDYTWSNSVTQTQASPALADFVYTTLGIKSVAVFQQNSDWGQQSNDLFIQRYQELGGTVTSTQAYLPDDKDFRSAITTVQGENPAGVVLFSYETDGALIAQQLRQAGVTAPIVSGASIQSPDYIKLGGDAAVGTYVLGEFVPSDPRPEMQKFVTDYRAKYNEDPDLFAAIAYDAIYIIKAAIVAGGPTRQGVHDGLSEIKDVPSVLYGKVTFDTTSRRVQAPFFEPLIVKDGDFVPLASLSGTAEPTAEATATS